MNKKSVAYTMTLCIILFCFASIVNADEISNNDVLITVKDNYANTINQEPYIGDTGLFSPIHVNGDNADFAKELMNGQVYFSINIESVVDNSFTVSNYKADSQNNLTMAVIMETLTKFVEKHSPKKDIVINIKPGNLDSDQLTTLKSTIKPVNKVKVLYNAEENVYTYNDIFKFKKGTNVVKGIQVTGLENLILTRNVENGYYKDIEE